MKFGCLSALAALALGCSDAAPAAGSEDVVGLDAISSEVAEADAAVPDGVDPTDVLETTAEPDIPDVGPPPIPTYTGQIAPILATHCRSCHGPDGIAPFEMGTYAEAAALAPVIRAAVATRRMPPWGVDNHGDCQSYRDARWLSDEEITTIGAWVDGGAREGPPAVEPTGPKAEALVGATHTIDMGVEYTPKADLADDYRCFVVDAGNAEDLFLTAYEVEPGEASIVHHIILYGLTSPKADSAVEALDEAEAGPGYSCYGGPRAPGGFGFLAGWAPGTRVTRYPEGTGIRLSGGHKAVLQIHYNLAAGIKADRTRIHLKLEPAVDAEALVLPLADLEMKLPPNSPVATATFSKTVDDDTTYHLLGVFPHMHLLGRTLRVELEHAGKTSCLVDVPRWDFNWQQFYFYDHPVDIVPGDTATLECTFDTTAIDSVVEWGEGTKDEMCLAGFYFTKN